MVNPKESNEFIRAQYTQYWEMIRLHLAFSWQIPALAVVSVIAFVNVGPEEVDLWGENPYLPAVSFFIIGMFLGIMFFHHHRNLLFVDHLERVVANLEKDFGVEIEVHHFQVKNKFRGWHAISSSRGLSITLLIIALVSFGISFFYIARFL